MEKGAEVAVNLGCGFSCRLDLHHERILYIIVY
jgi:hypothetical protein